MEDEIVSVRVDKMTKEKMKMLEHINWSAILRRAIMEQLSKQQERENAIDIKRAKKAARDADRIRESGAFSGGKTGTEIIREWRNKRRF